MTKKRQRRKRQYANHRAKSNAYKQNCPGIERMGPISDYYVTVPNSSYTACPGKMQTNWMSEFWWLRR